MPAVADGVLVYASDPELLVAGVTFDFVSGAVLLAVALEPPPTVTATAEVALGTATANAAGVHTAPTPDPVTPPTTRASRLPAPRTTGGRTVRLQAVANLGRLTAHTITRIELADEEIIELL